MSRSETAHALLRLRHQASAELERLNRERHRLEHLIRFIDEYAVREPARSKGVKKRSPRRTSASVVDMIQEHPGVRASMLALVLGRPLESVSEELELLERERSVKREGRGWRVHPA